VSGEIKTIGGCVEEFSKSVIKYGECILKDASQANRHYDRFINALRDLATFGDKGLSALAELLDDDRLIVRVTAASYLVHFRTAKALEVLRAATTEDRGIAMLAIVTLKRWEQGTYLHPATGHEVRIRPKPIIVKRDGGIKPDGRME